MLMRKNNAFCGSSSRTYTLFILYRSLNVCPMLNGVSTAKSPWKLGHWLFV